MKTPKEKDRIEALKLTIREAEQYVDPFIEKIKKSDDPNSLTDEAVSLLRIIAKARFEIAVEQGESEVLKYIDDLKNIHFYNKEQIEEKLKEWITNICVRPPYRAATSENPKPPFHWVIKQKLVFEQSKQNFINTAVGILRSGVCYKGDNIFIEAKTLIERFHLAQYNFLNDCYQLIVLDSIATTINKYLSGKLSNEPTAKAKPKEKVYTIDDYLSTEGLKRKEKIVERIKAAKKPQHVHFVLIAANELDLLNFDLSKRDLTGRQIDFANMLFGLNEKTGARQGLFSQTLKLFETFNGANPGDLKKKIEVEIQKLKT